MSWVAVVMEKQFFFSCAFLFTHFYFIQIIQSLGYGDMLVQQHLLFFVDCFVCTYLQIASECNSKHEMNSERN